jgi:fatty acid synthase subunit beta
LCGLVTNLRKIRALSRLDQSKILLSAFSARFLAAGVPCWSGYINWAAEKLAGDLEEELWKSEDLKIPVFHA